MARSSTDDSAMLCISGFVDDVRFSHNGPYTDTGDWRIIYRDSPAGTAYCAPGMRSALAYCLVVTDYTLLYDDKRKSNH